MGVHHKKHDVRSKQHELLLKKLHYIRYDDAQEQYPTSTDDCDMLNGENTEMTNTMFCARQRCLVHLLVKDKAANNAEDLEMHTTQLLELCKMIVERNNSELLIDITELDKSKQLILYRLLSYYLHVIDIVNRCIVSAQPKYLYNAIHTFLGPIGQSELELSDDASKALDVMKQTLGLSDIYFSTANVEQIVNNFKASVCPKNSFKPVVISALPSSSASAAEFIKNFNSFLKIVEPDEAPPAFKLDEDSDTEDNEKSEEKKAKEPSGEKIKSPPKPSATEIPDEKLPSRPFIGLSLNNKKVDLNKIKGYGGERDIRDAFGYTKIRIKNQPPEYVLFVTEEISKVMKQEPRPNIIAWTIWLANELDRRVDAHLNNPDADIIKQPLQHLTLAEAKQLLESGKIQTDFFLNGETFGDGMYTAGIQKQTFPPHTKSDTSMKADQSKQGFSPEHKYTEKPKTLPKTSLSKASPPKTSPPKVSPPKKPPSATEPAVETKPSKSPSKSPSKTATAAKPAEEMIVVDIKEPPKRRPPPHLAKRLAEKKKDTPAKDAADAPPKPKLASSKTATSKTTATKEKVSAATVPARPKPDEPKPSEDKPPRHELLTMLIDGLDYTICEKIPIFRCKSKVEPHEMYFMRETLREIEKLLAMGKTPDGIAQVLNSYDMKEAKMNEKAN